MTLCGWVHRKRDLGGFVFLDLRDRAGLVQVVIDPATAPAAAAAAKDVRAEFVVRLAGTVAGRGDNINPKLPTGQIEVRADRLEKGPAAPAETGHTIATLLTRLRLLILSLYAHLKTLLPFPHSL